MESYTKDGIRVIVDVVREVSSEEEGVRIRGPRDVADLFRTLQERGRIPREREAFVAFFLDAKYRLRGVHVVSIGHLQGSLVHPREVFRPAIVEGAAALVVAHNHPSGDPEPSGEDRAVTERLRSVGELVGIPLLDHVVVTEESEVGMVE